MGLAEPGGNSPSDHSPVTKTRSVRAAVLGDDQRQIEMDFSFEAELKLDKPTEGDVVQVESALSDLDRLEGEIFGSEVSTGQAG